MKILYEEPSVFKFFYHFLFIGCVIFFVLILETKYKKNKVSIWRKLMLYVALIIYSLIMMFSYFNCVDSEERRKKHTKITCGVIDIGDLSYPKNDSFEKNGDEFKLNGLKFCSSSAYSKQLRDEYIFKDKSLCIEYLGDTEYNSIVKVYSNE